MLSIADTNRKAHRLKLKSPTFLESVSDKHNKKEAKNENPSNGSDSPSGLGVCSFLPFLNRLRPRVKNFMRLDEGIGRGLLNRAIGLLGTRTE